MGSSWGQAGSRPGVAAAGGNDGFAKANPSMPFDPLAASKRDSKLSASSKNNVDFESGERVSHAKFGEGMVVSVDGKTISVMFDSAGLKKLAKDIAPIKKI